MPFFFKPMVWTYFGLAMLAILFSLGANMRISLGRIRLPVAGLLIFLVGLSLLVAVGLSYGIGTLRAEGMDMKFIGRSEYTDPTSHRKVRMVSELRDGFWFAIYGGGALVFLGLTRFLFVRKWGK
jgi:hypothetical protein